MDEQPKLISIKKPWVFANYSSLFSDRTVVKFSAFGSEQEVSIGPAASKEYNGDFSAIINATFQDPRDNGPIIIADSVALWLPGEYRSRFTPPDHARVALAEGKPLPRKVVAIPTALMKHLEFPLVKDAKAQGFTPDNHDRYLVCRRSSVPGETVMPIGRWLMRFENKKHTPYIERIGFD